MNFHTYISKINLLIKLKGHSQIENSFLNIDPTSKSWPPSHSKLDLNVYFSPKQRSTFSQISIAIVNSHQSSILYIDRTSWNCNITRSIHVACTISWAITTDCWKPKQKNFLPSADFLFNEDSESVENTCNLARLGNIETSSNFFKPVRYILETKWPLH